MPARKILFTDLVDPLQRELLGRYRRETDARVFCLAETEAESVPVKLDQLSELGVDEVWHSATPGPILRAIASAGIPVINYLATAGPGWESLQAAALLNPSAPSQLAVDFAEEIEAEFLRARKESGLSYRIFKPRNLINACGKFPYPRANTLYNLLGELVGLKQEIEDKSEGYFARHSLRVDGTISVALLSLTQAAESFFKIAADEMTLNGSYDIAGFSAVTLADLVGPLSESLGIKIEPESDRTTFNPIDLLLDDRLSVGRSVSDAAPDRLPNNELIVRSFMSAYAERTKQEAARVERARQALQPRMIEKENAEPLCYYTGGSGVRTIVIVNAYGQGLAYWTRLVADLVENFRVIIWLARGNRHDTVGVNKSFSVTDHREDLKELLTREQVRKADFVGWCTGPKLILDYYAAYPDDVASMIFLGTTFKDWPSQPQSDTEYEKSLAPLLTMVHQRPQLAPRLIDSLRKVLLARNGDGPSLAAGDPHAHKQAMKMLGAPCSDLKQAVIEPLLSEASVVSYSEQLLDFWHHDVTRVFENVRVPVLFVSGECDQIAHASMAKAAVQMIPGAKRVEVKGGSHYLLYERSALTSNLIELFCNSMSIRTESNRDIQWVRSPKPNPRALLRLFCFPYAGGSDLTFRTWPMELPGAVEVCGIQLPGHGNRLREPLIDRMEPLVDALTPMLVPHLDRPFAFFGHSMGAMISFEVARRLRRDGAPQPDYLFVSGRPAPQLPDQERRTYALPEPEFLEELRRLNGTPKEVLEHPELLQLTLPIIRSDFALCQNYHYAAEAPLDYPIFAFGGVDDAEVSREQLQAWGDQTAASFTLRMLAGDHFFLISARALLLQALSGVLEQLIVERTAKLSASLTP